MVVPNAAHNPAIAAAQRKPRRIVSWIVVDGVAEKVIGNTCCLVLVVAVESPNGNWIRVIRRAVPKDSRQQALQEIHIEAERAIRSGALVHGAVEVFFSSYLSLHKTVIWRSSRTQKPLPLQLRASATHSLNTSLALLEKQVRTLATKVKPRKFAVPIAPKALMHAIASQLPAVRLATDASKNTTTHTVSIGWVSDHGDYGSTLIHRGTKITEAEYTALVRALIRIVRRHPGRRVHAYTDSKQAVVLLRRRQHNNEVVQQLLQTGMIRVYWVRGHHGHPLNEAAHRLAVHTRRSVEWDIPEKHRIRVERQIMQDLWDELAV